MKKKLFRITTASESVAVLLKGQLKYLSQDYDITAISSGPEILKRVARKQEFEKYIPMS